MAIQGIVIKIKVNLAGYFQMPFSNKLYDESPL